MSPVSAPLWTMILLTVLAVISLFFQEYGYQQKRLRIQFNLYTIAMLRLAGAVVAGTIPNIDQHLTDPNLSTEEREYFKGLLRRFKVLQMAIKRTTALHEHRLIADRMIHLPNEPNTPEDLKTMEDLKRRLGIPEELSS